jgi:hypothetical protein
LQKLKGIVAKALDQTASLWPDVQAGFAWVHRAATILGNPDGVSGVEIRERYETLKTELRQAAHGAARGGGLRRGLDHFLKVTASYEPGLFHCYDVSGLPRTNNDLEQLFGATRRHERRCTGRKAASPGLVLRGSVRIVARLGAGGHPFNAADLAPRNLDTWRTVRGALEQRRQARVLRSRFRRDPVRYLQTLEDDLLKPTLPV